MILKLCDVDGCETILRYPADGRIILVRYKGQTLKDAEQRVVCETCYAKLTAKPEDKPTEQP